MYNLQPVYSQGFTGAGVTIAIAAQSDIDPSVLATFWSAFGVSGPSFGLPAQQQFTSVAVSPNTDPGQTKDGNEDEAYLDTEILGALAPGAQLILVRDQDAALPRITRSTRTSRPSSISRSASARAHRARQRDGRSMYQQAMTEGITVTVSSDDAGVVGCIAQSDLGVDVNSNGFAVNGLASTPYNLAVGGTDFNDLSPSTAALYWRRRIKRRRSRAPPLTFPKWCGTTRVQTRCMPMTSVTPDHILQHRHVERAEQPVHRHLGRW